MWQMKMRPVAERMSLIRIVWQKKGPCVAERKRPDLVEMDLWRKETDMVAEEEDLWQKEEALWQKETDLWQKERALWQMKTRPVAERMSLIRIMW